MTISRINPYGVNPISEVPGQMRPANAVEQVSKSFGQMLDSLNESQQKSDELLKSMSAGENVDIHTAMIATEEADINFRVALAIRDRLVDAYREVMRMSV